MRLRILLATPLGMHDNLKVPRGRSEEGRMNVESNQREIERNKQKLWKETYGTTPHHCRR